MNPAEPLLLFDVPGGRLEFGPGELDIWAEHLAWCLRLMGIRDGATIAVQDFGSSPAAFLGSALLMPHLKRGVAEHLGGRFICLDASLERVTLTPAMLAQLAVDALIVRAEVMPMLNQVGGRDLARAALHTIVTFRDDQMMRLAPGSRQLMLMVEAAMLLAPQCLGCRCFHVREGFYSISGGEVRNLKLASAATHWLAGAEVLPPGGCTLSADSRLRYRMRMQTGEA